jgi:N-acetylmuramoyl-L-alanine amidase
MDVINNLLSPQEGDPFTFEGPPPSVPLPPLNAGIDSLIIRRTAALSMQNARNIYFDPGRKQLVHLFIGADAKEVIQMVPFDHLAGYSYPFNRTAISLGLINRGELFVGDQYKDHYNYIEKHDGDYLYGFGDNDSRYRVWASYPPEQLNLLVEICDVLIRHYNIRHVHTYENLSSIGLDPGPSFPKVRFFEVLKTAHKNMNISLRVLDQTNREVRLHHHPEAGALPAEPKRVPSGRSIAVVDENAGWSLVEVMDAANQGEWLKGWINSDAIEMPPLTPLVENELLVTDDGRKYPFLEAASSNYNTRPGSNQPKYLIMHFTTGTEMRQTINTFQNPSEGVSTHLLIGRDGRVIQFVPFDHAANHCGFSYWEDQSRLNNCTIGIELDNAGYLSLSEDGQNWVRKGKVIPPDQEEEARHIKDYSSRHWEIFPRQQLDAAFAIAKALVKKYKLVDILGHDQVNVKFRKDPGPLFEEHIQALRSELFDRPDAETTVYKTVAGEDGGEIKIYRDNLGRKPVLNHPLVPGVRLRAGRPVKVLEKHGVWWVIRLLSGDRPVGWVLAADILELTQVTKINRENTLFYQVLTTSNAGPPPTEHWDSPLQPGKKLRIQKFDGDMALIAIVVERNNLERLIEGWVSTELIKKESGGPG